MSKLLVCAALTAMLLGACGGDNSPTASTPDGSPTSSAGRSPGTESTGNARDDDSDDPIDPASGATARPLSDNALIRDLWLGFSEAWKDGPAGAEGFLEKNNYPPYQKDSELCRQLDEDRGIQRKAFTFDDNTVKRNDGWTIPEGTQKGREPPGRIYSMTVRELRTSDDGNRSTTGTSHISIEGGKAYLFYDCRYFYERDQANR